jgi:hypothetical protein
VWSTITTKGKRGFIPKLGCPKPIARFNTGARAPARAARCRTLYWGWRCNPKFFKLEFAVSHTQGGRTRPPPVAEATLLPLQTAHSVRSLAPIEDLIVFLAGKPAAPAREIFRESGCRADGFPTGQSQYLKKGKLLYSVSYRRSLPEKAALWRVALVSPCRMTWSNKPT